MTRTLEESRGKPSTLLQVRAALKMSGKRKLATELFNAQIHYLSCVIK